MLPNCCHAIHNLYKEKGHIKEQWKLMSRAWNGRILLYCKCWQFPTSCKILTNGKQILTYRQCLQHVNAGTSLSRQETTTLFPLFVAALSVHCISDRSPTKQNSDHFSILGTLLQQLAAVNLHYSPYLQLYGTLAVTGHVMAPYKLSYYSL